MSTHRLLAKSAGTLGFFTGVSRVLGFVRDLVIATAFGTGLAAEAFVVSFKIPNLLRDLVGEGAANAAFVPVLTECREKRGDQFWTLVSTLFLTMAAILFVLSSLGIFFTPEIVRLLAPGFVGSTEPEKFPLTVRLTRAIFPYLFLIGLTALAMGVLNSLKEFTSSALGPILLNLSMIVAGYGFERRYGPMALVAGVLAGGALQFGCQVPFLLKKGFRFRAPRWRDPALGRIGKLLVPRALGSALYQINVFVDSILASFDSIVGPGGQSALYYSNRLFQLPLAIFGVSLAQAILPTFSTQIVREDLKGFKETFSLALTTLALVVLPASVGLAVLSRPIVKILFQYGRFDAYSTSVTSDALGFYAFGLLSCCFIKIFVNAFYSMQDTKTPVKTMLFSVVLNIILSLFFMRFLKIGGLALASTLSATANMALLYYFLRKKIGPPDERRMLARLIKMVLAAAAMGLFCWGWRQGILDPAAGQTRLLQAFYLGSGIFLSVVFYFALAFLLRIEEARKIFFKT